MIPVRPEIAWLSDVFFYSRTDALENAEQLEALSQEIPHLDALNEAVQRVFDAFSQHLSREELHRRARVALQHFDVVLPPSPSPPLSSPNIFSRSPPSEEKHPSLDSQDRS